MTQKEFQGKVLEFLQELKQFTMRQEGVNQRQEGVNQRQERVNQRQEEVNQRQEEVNQRQEEVNQTLLESQDGIIKLIEHEVVERFAGMSDGTKAYTDVKIHQHETNYHPRSTLAESNL